MKYVRGIFLILSVLFFGYFIAGQIFLPVDIEGRSGICFEYKEDVWSVNEDGSKEKLKNTSKLDEVHIIETVLPAEIDNGVTAFCFGGKDISAYVDGELRFTTNAKNNGWFSNASPEHYMMIPISKADEGKNVRIEIQNGSGVFYQLYMGSEFGIWSYILKLYAGELVVAAITLIMGVLTIIISKTYGIINGRKIEISYLGFGVSYAAIWLIVNSVYRQILFRNLSVASDFPFLMVMLIPYPFLIYMNIVQEKRFEKIYFIASSFLTAVNILNISLYVTGIKGLVETFIWVALACGAAIATVIFSFVVDLRNGKLKEYKFVAFGLFGAFSAAIIQLVAYFNRTGVFSGAYLAVGLLCLLIGAAIHTVHSVFLIEKDKTAAILASESKGKFLSSMSHEIRTPINAVLGMDEMILREVKEPNIRDYALDIQNAGKSLLALVNDILDISKIESGKMEIILVEYDVSSALNDTMNMIYHKAKEKDLYAEIKVDENLPSRLKGDDIRIRQVLINILNNAVKYTQEGGVELNITGELIDEKYIMLHFEIRDTGIGIKEEDLPKLYAQFERIEEERNRTVEGTGLGMSITLQLLELMNTRLNVKSEYGKGSCFYFDLKQEIVDFTPIGNLSERISAQRKEYAYQNTFCARDADILVVDDNSVNRKVVRSLLKDTGIRIHETDSGEKCLEMIQERKYDIIFLDHMMPGLDGIQTLQKFPTLENNLNKTTPVIALTANAVTGAREMYLKAGFIDYLTKPIIYNKLEAMLLQYLPGEKIESVSVVASEMVNNDVEDERSRLLSEILDLNMDYAVMLNGNLDSLCETLKEFAGMIDSDIKDINQYKKMLPDEEAYKQYRVKVHSLKASAMLVGLVYLSGIARTLELAAINRKLDVIEAVHGILVEELVNKKEQLKPLLGDNESDLELIEFNRDLVLEQLGLLAEAVSDVDVDRADEIVELLKGVQYPENLKEKMDEVFSAAMGLEEKTIIKVIEELL